MLFSSLIFLFAFLPLLLLVYYILPERFRNYVLILFSIVFYAWGGVSYTAILILSILINYLLVNLINRSKSRKKMWLITGLAFNILVIVIFKYLDFFIDNINLLGLLFDKEFSPLPMAGIVLPLGISFFTFQEMSLLWDVYRNPVNKPIKLHNTALYISFFPQLIAGPIVRYKDIIQQIKSRKESTELFSSGVQRFIIGLFKKIIFANSCGAIADSIMDQNISNIDTPIAWLGIVSYALQIYFDFSGYSDMAIGLGRMFGFRILENFNFPYVSHSIREFWRRWHISLSNWFRDYVYIPMGGNRKGPYKTYLNLIIVFLLTGFWHGATWSFVFWGVFHGTFLILERAGLGKLLEKVPGIFSWAYAILVVLIGWVFFRIEVFMDAFYYVLKLFGHNNGSLQNYMQYLDMERIIILSLAILYSLTFNKLKVFTVKIMNGKLFYPMIIARNILLLVMLLYSVMYINSGSYNPFIYFRF